MTTPHSKPDVSRSEPASASSPTGQNSAAGEPSVGHRSRFRSSRPPALAPEPKPTLAPGAIPEVADTTAVDHSTLAEAPSARVLTQAEDADGASGKNTETEGNEEQTSDAQVVRAGGSMAIATLISRITGFMRMVLIGSVLGPAVASAFNTANTLPNLITELVLGAVLTALVVPVLVRAEKEDSDKGEAFIRRLLTLTFSLTVIITLLSILLTPVLTRVMLDTEGKVDVQMATAFGYLVLPQIFFYAMFAVFMAILNTKQIFKPGAWAPVANNVVTLAVLAFYLLLPDSSKLQPFEHVTITNPHVMLLGLGTTLGVVVQALIMVPYLRKAGINLRPLWGIDDRLKSFGGMAVAIIVYVAISQVGFALNNRIAANSSDAAALIYQQAWQLLQVPYGVIGVTLLTAVMPRLSRNAADGDDKAVVGDLTMASKLTMMALIPVIVFFTCFGTLIASALFAYGNYSLDTANVLGWTISFSAFTLIPYALVLLHLRVFYAREEVWTPTFIIAGITITKLALAFSAPLIATETRLVVVLLGAANGMGFIAGAIIGHQLLRRSLGDLQFRSVLKAAGWAMGSSLVGAFISWRLDALLCAFVFPQDGAAHPWFLIRMAIAGIVFLLITGLVLSRSRLPEVATVGAALSRLPGISRFVSTPASGTSDSLPGRPLQNPEAAVLASAADTMMPVLPPLSAGRVRGPRLVAGAPILGGAYRLLADHGGSAAARLWQAREMSTGNVVALTIMDPTVVGGHKGRDEATSRTRNGAARAQAKAQILRRAKILQSVDTPGMATIHQVVDGGSLVLVISEWVHGSSLNDVAESTPDPLAAGFAVANLADAAADAADAGSPIGLDHRDRVRISTAGTAVLAFPGALPDNSIRQDAHGVATTLGLLLHNVPIDEVPEGLTREYQDLREIARDKDTQPDLRDTAATLRRLTSGELSISEDTTPNPSQQAGFGVEKVRPRTLVTAGATGLLSAIVIAALVIAAVTFFGGNRDNSPVSNDSLRESAGSLSQQEPANVPLDNVKEWLPTNGRGTEDNPESVELTIDGNPATTWETDMYQAQLGPGPGSVKEGIGVLIELPEGTSPTEITVEGLRPGTVMELRSSTGDPATLTDTAVLSTLRADSSTETVTLDKPAAANTDNQPAKSNRLLLWITELPQPDAATIGEVKVKGTWKDQQSSSAPATATQSP
ncbi:murein biosynthesis integral membrane protein MurJ [Corynebacterium suicordis]